MKNEGLILASVLGFCALFGMGVSQVATPVVSGIAESVSVQVQNGSEESSAETPQQALKDSLTAHYPNIVFTEDQLSSLACGEENWFGNKDCYEGPTKEVKKYGSANIVMDGKPTYVRLVSMPAGAFLNK